MAVIHYPGFITKEEAARREGVQVRTINSHIKKKSIGFVKIDKRILIKEIAGGRSTIYELRKRKSKN